MPEDPRRFYESKDAPHSRLFIISPKNLTEEDFRKAFEPFGKIEDIFIVKDRATGDNKGVTYIKFLKTSEAARALEALNGESIGSGRPLKVMIASKPEEGNRDVDFEEISHRLFVVIPKNMSDDELNEYFKKFGEIHYARVVRDRNTKESKGVAHVKFSKFSEAADAFEKCEKSFKAVFARPKKSKEEKEVYLDFKVPMDEGPSRYLKKRSYSDPSTDLPLPDRYRDEGYNKLMVIANPMLNQDQIWKLFDVIPTMDFCDVRYDGDRAHIEVVYKNSRWAAYAKEKLHGFEYPPGHRLIVRSEFEASRSPQGPSSVDGNRQEIFKLAETLVQATSHMKKSDLSEILQPLLGGGGHNSFSSNKRGSSSSMDDYNLPKMKPLVKDAEMRARCFIVCHPKPLSSNILKDLFCRFGNLIDVYLVKGKNYGYAMYASEPAANNAIRELHGYECLGVRLKVIEAEDRPDSKRMRTDQDF